VDVLVETCQWYFCIQVFLMSSFSDLDLNDHVLRGHRVDTGWTPGTRAAT